MNMMTMLIFLGLNAPQKNFMNFCRFLLSSAARLPRLLGLRPPPLHTAHIPHDTNPAASENFCTTSSLLLVIFILTRGPTSISRHHAHSNTTRGNAMYSLGEIKILIGFYFNTIRNKCSPYFKLR